MEGNNLKATTVGDDNPRRSRTKNLIGTLVATGLLFGAVQALSPASAAAMIKQESAAECQKIGGWWDTHYSACITFDDAAGGSGGGGTTDSGGSTGGDGGGGDGGSGGGTGSGEPLPFEYMDTETLEEILKEPLDPVTKAEVEKLLEDRREPPTGGGRLSGQGSMGPSGLQAKKRPLATDSPAVQKRGSKDRRGRKTKATKSRTRR